MLGDYNKAQIGLEGYYIGVILPKNELRCTLIQEPSILQIFPHLKFGTDRSTGLKVMAKKLFWTQINFLVITFKPVDRLISNFECDKICMVWGLVGNAIKPLSQ